MSGNGEQPGANPGGQGGAGGALFQARPQDPPGGGGGAQAPGPAGIGAGPG